MGTQAAIRGVGKKPKIKSPTTGDGRLSLGLRTLLIENELREKNLPSDAKELMNEALKQRELRFQAKYDLVFIYIKMKQKGSFWEDFGCKSLDELLASLDLPGGSTLAIWENMVRLFSKETFLLIGDDILGYMILEVNRHIKDNDARRQAYSTIFERYCKSNKYFEKRSFVRTVNIYVNETFVPPAQAPDKFKRAPRNAGTGQTLCKVPVESTKGSNLPNTVEVEIRECAGCLERNAYIYELEKQLRRIGAVPTRPRNLEKALASH